MWKLNRTYTVFCAFKYVGNFSYNHFINNNSGKVVGFVHFSNTNTKICKIVYYTQSVDVCRDEQK